MGVHMTIYSAVLVLFGQSIDTVVRFQLDDTCVNQSGGGADSWWEPLSYRRECPLSSLPILVAIVCLPAATVRPLTWNHVTNGKNGSIMKRLHGETMQLDMEERFIIVARNIKSEMTQFRKSAECRSYSATVHL